MDIAIVISKFHLTITSQLLDGAKKCLSDWSKKNKTKYLMMEFWVGGVFEIPYALKMLTINKKFSCAVALGCVIKGETQHDFYIAQSSISAIHQIVIKECIPIGFGILTVNTFQQAIVRSQDGNNKGYEATSTVLDLLDQFGTF